MFNLDRCCSDTNDTKRPKLVTNFEVLLMNNLFIGEYVADRICAIG